MDTPDERAREREEEDRVDEREPTVIELMNGPGRPSPRRKATVLWIALAFATAMLAMTVAVIAFYGLDLLTVTTAVVLGFTIAAMIGQLRYKGEDPMAQFDPPERPRSRGLFRKRD